MKTVKDWPENVKSTKYWVLWECEFSQEKAHFVLDNQGRELSTSTDMRHREGSNATNEMVNKLYVCEFQKKKIERKQIILRRK